MHCFSGHAPQQNSNYNVQCVQDHDNTKKSYSLQTSVYMTVFQIRDGWKVGAGLKYRSNKEHGTVYRVGLLGILLPTIITVPNMSYSEQFGLFLSARLETQYCWVYRKTLEYDLS